MFEHFNVVVASLDDLGGGGGLPPREDVHRPARVRHGRCGHYGAVCVEFEEVVGDGGRGYSKELEM